MRTRHSLQVLTSCFLAVMLVASTGSAQVLKRQTALGIVPADAEFFASYLRNKEQIDRLLGSKAFKKLLELPAVQAGLKQLSDLFTQEGSPVKAILDQPDNKELAALLQDALSNEIAIYGERGFGKTLLVWQSVMNTIQSAQYEAILAGRNPNEVIAKRMLQAVGKALSDSKLPTMVIAMRVAKPAIAKKQLGRLEQLVKAVTQVQPALAGRVKRGNIGRGDYLTLSLKGSDLPLDEIGEELGEKEAAKLIAALKKQTLSISLGVQSNYIVLSIGADSKHLARLGGDKILADRSELAPLHAVASKKLTSISYASQEFMHAVASPASQLNQLSGMMQQYLPLTGLSKGLQKEIADDIGKLISGAAKSLGSPGTTFGYSFMTPSGYEGFTYDLGKKNRTPMEPITIVNHLGGDPMFGIASRERQDPNEFGQLVTFIKKCDYYAQKIAKEKLAGDQLAKFNQVRKALLPLFKKLGQTTRDNLIPAVEGQSAFVIDFKTSAKSWHQLMPPHSKPLPMIGMAVVISVRDAGKLKQAAQDYFAVVQGVVDVVGKLNPGAVGGYKLPAPKEKAAADGRVYYYSLPEFWGVNQLIAPNAGLNKSVAVMSFSPDQSARIMAAQTAPSMAAMLKRHPQAHTVTHFQSSSLISALKTWGDYAYGFVAGFQAEDEVKLIQNHIDVITEFIGCFKSYTSATYPENKATVTHAIWKFADVK